MLAEPQIPWLTSLLGSQCNRTLLLTPCHVPPGNSSNFSICQVIPPASIFPLSAECPSLLFWELGAKHVNFLIFSSFVTTLDASHKNSSPLLLLSCGLKGRSVTLPLQDQPLAYILTSLFPLDFSGYHLPPFPFLWLLSPSWKTCSGHPYLKICTVFLTLSLSQFPIQSLTLPPPNSILHCAQFLIHSSTQEIFVAWVDEPFYWQCSFKGHYLLCFHSTALSSFCYCLSDLSVSFPPHSLNV